MKDHQKLNLVEDNALRFWLGFPYNPKVPRQSKSPGALSGMEWKRFQACNLSEEKSE